MDFDTESQNSRKKKEIPADMDEEESRSSKVLHSTWLDEEIDDALKISQMMERS